MGNRKALEGDLAYHFTVSKAEMLGEANGQGYQVATGPSSELIGHVYKTR